MLLKDLVIFFKNETIAPLAKMVRLEIPQDMKKQIEQNHLYHITPNEEVSEKIVNSEYLKPSTRNDEKS